MKKILVIEDNPELRDNITELLSKENYIVHATGNGKTGVEIALEEIPDLVLCDIMMPGIDGYEVFSLLKANSATDSIPFVIMSGETNQSYKCKGLELGAEDYLLKPFDESVLISTVAGRIKKSESLKEKIEQERLLHIKELEDILHMISHSVRGPLCSSLGLVKLLNISNAAVNTDLNKILEGIKQNTQKLNECTAELSGLMHASLMQHKNKMEKLVWPSSLPHKE